MKKIRVFLAASALLLTAGAAFAFKANSKAGSGTLYFFDDNVCTQDITCAPATSGNECPGQHYTDENCTDMTSLTEVVVD